MRGRPAIAVLALAASGCATADGVLRQRMVREHACPEASVKVTQLPGQAYLVEGCGLRQTFVCIQAPDWVCVREGDPDAAETLTRAAEWAKNPATAKRILPLSTPAPGPPPPPPASPGTRF
jgi:hypothetical protein